MESKRVVALMKDKLDAINNNDLDAYMKTVTLNDVLYINEQKRWFLEMTNDEMKDVSFEVEEVVKREDEIVATIHQTHHYGVDFDITYPLVLRVEDGLLRDCGYDFNVIDEGEFIIKYMSNDEKAWMFHDMIRQAFKNVDSIFGRIPDFTVEIKIFSDKEMLRQRTIPTIPWQFSAWGEPNESLKFFTGLENVNNYAGLIQHELVHMVTLDVCAGKAPQWMAEGIAMKYGNGSYEHEDDLVLSKMDQYDIGVPISILKEFNLYTASDIDLIGEYYATCYMYFYYLDKYYGIDKIMEVFREIGLSSDTEKDRIAEMAIQKVLGISTAKLSEKYLRWIY